MPGGLVERSSVIAQVVRLTSFAAALAISLALMLFPFVLRHVPGTRLHLALPIVLLGVTAAFVHGVGFVPDHRLLWFLLGPACAWILMAAGALLLLPSP